MKTKMTAGAVALAIAITGGAALFAKRDPAAPEVTTDVVSRGSIVNAISATGTLEALTTVQVGAQTSGSVQALYADFNSIVKRGQLLARLDPSTFDTQVEQAKANLAKAQADLDRLRVAAEDAAVKAQRARDLSAKQLIARQDLDAADVAERVAKTQVASGEAQVTQARAALAQAQVARDKTVITSPVDGTVIARDVDVGQTVSASMQAPTLFTIAADLRQMQVKASIDESDVGQLQEGQPVTFRVDAYPNDTFHGVVDQVRLTPVTVQNVVTYSAIITAPNPDLKLKPGMTVTATIEVARRDDVLRVPSAALRFRPTDDTLKAFSQQRAQTQGPSVWVFDGTLHQQSIKTGATNGTFTEIPEGSLPEGARVVTRVATADENAKTQTLAKNNPLLAQPGPQRRF
jgi:HlyD family secretion protein